MIQILLYYISLLFFTIIIFRNAYLSYRKSNDFTLLITSFFIYYFTLGGAIIFPIDEYNNFEGVNIGLHYLPIFEKLFVVHFDTDYILSVVFYIVFILVFQYSYLYAQKRYGHKIESTLHPSTVNAKEIIINPILVFCLSMLLIFVSAYLLRREISFAIFSEKSVYLITRANKNPLYTLHQLANEFCVLIPFIAYSFSIIKNNSSNIKVKNSRFTISLLLLACILSSVYIAFLGNRREILSGIIVCILISLNHFKHINKPRFAYIFMVVLCLFLANDFFRSTIIPRYLNGVLKPQKDESLELKKDEEEFYTSSKYTKVQKSKQILGSFMFSNELFYAHFSMYGAIHHKIPITYGSSFKYLASSVIPRAIYPNRPPDIYSHYAASVNALPGQLYTMHHATAWYLNFGFVGLILGAIILALIFSSSLFLKIWLKKYQNTFVIYLLYLLPILLTSQIVTFITAGPEAYKSMILEGIIIPVFLLVICSKNMIVKKVIE